VTLYTIKGDVDEIERSTGKTEVIVNEGNSTVAYQLDEPLIEFGFAVESRDFDKAASILDPLEMTADTEANWKVLAQIALDE
jgi:intraflagellar transport protein 172